MSDFGDGAKNDLPAQVIRKHMPSALKGKVWDALIEAIASGDSGNWENAQKAFKQLFLSTASGKYLDRLAGDNGVSRPPVLGLGDDPYRELAIKTTAEKLTQESYYNVLEVFYGSGSVRAWIESSSAPWNLVNGDTLFVSLDGTRVPDVVFRSEDFQYIAHATAREVAAVLTRHFQLHKVSGYASEEIGENGRPVVRIYSGSRGLASSVQILGGSAQTRFNFDTRLELTPPGSVPTDVTWTITTPPPGQLLFQPTDDINLFSLQVGDYVVINGLVFSTANRGTFTIKEVNIFYSGGSLVKQFVVEANGVAETVTPQTTNDIVFFSPEKKTIQDGDRIVSLSQANGGVIVTVPATTSAVVRGPETAAYLHDGELLEVLSLERVGTTVTVHTAIAHGLNVASGVIVEGAYSLGTAPVSPGTAGNTDASYGNVVSDLGLALVAPSGVVATSNGFVIVDDNDSYAVTLGAETPATTGGVHVAYTVGPAVALTGTSSKHTLFTASTGAVYAIPTEATSSSVSMEKLTTSWAATTLTIPGTGAAASLTGNTIVVTGGFDTATTDETFLYNVLTDTYSTIPALESILPTCLGSQVTLANDSTLYCGGSTGYSAGPTDALSISYILANDFVGGWTRVGNMAAARAGHATLLLPDGRVLAIGGVSASGSGLATVEVFDPLLNSWSYFGNMCRARAYPSATLDDGKVYITSVEGGCDVYDTTTGTWRCLEDLTGSSVASLNGKVLALDAAANLLVVGETVTAANGLNGSFGVASVIDSTTFTYESWVDAYSIGMGPITVKKMAAELNTHLGPYILEPGASTVVDVGASLVSDIHAGVSYAILQLDDATAFPDEEGWIVIGYGTEADSGPIKYLGRASLTSLLLEFAPVATTNLAGANVSLVRTLPTEELDIPSDAHLAYVTGSNLGLARLRTQLSNVAAAGVNLDIQVVYPGDRGLGGEGLPATGPKVSDKVVVWGGDDIDAELEEAHNE